MFMRPNSKAANTNRNRIGTTVANSTSVAPRRRRRRTVRGRCSLLGVMVVAFIGTLRGSLLGKTNSIGILANVFKDLFQGRAIGGVVVLSSTERRNGLHARHIGV